MQTCSNYSVSDVCGSMKATTKTVKEKSRDHDSSKNIASLSIHDDVPKIYIDEFADQGIFYSDEILCMTRKDEIFTIHESKVNKYNKHGIFVLQLQSEYIRNPIDVATWNNGQVLLSDSGTDIGDGQILLFKADGHFSRVLVSGLSSPVGIATDSDNNTYVCDKIDNCLLKFNDFGYLVHVLKLFNTPTFVALGPYGNIVVSDADGIYCLDRNWEIIWKHNLITGCKFGMLACGCAVVDHAPNKKEIREALDPVISVIGNANATVENSKLGTSGIYVDSKQGVWVGVASERHFRQLQVSHDIRSKTCHSNKSAATKARSGKKFLSKAIIRSPSMDYVDYALPWMHETKTSMNKDILFDVICDQRLSDEHRKWTVAHRMKGKTFQTCYSQIKRAFSFDNPVSLLSFLEFYRNLKTTFLSQMALEDIILHEVYLDSPSSLDNALLSVVECKTNLLDNSLIVYSLLQYGANVNAKDFAGNTALHKAVMCGKELQVRLLLAFGADPSAINERGDTPIYLALLYSQHDCAKAMLWCLSRFFMQNHNTISVWPGYNPEVVKSFQAARRLQAMNDSAFLSHLKNQRDICSQMHKHANWLKKKDTLKDEQGIYIVSQVDRKSLKKTTTFRGIKIIWRNEFDVSTEAKYLESKGILRVQNISDKVAETIRSVLKEEAPKLFSLHSNLTIISPSGVKSSGFASTHGILHQICIGLYCRVKGTIPLGENPYPEKVGPFPTDVREGYPTLGHGPKGPNEYHDKLKIGCCISADNGSSSGTLGGFVEIDKEDYFVTAAHVLFDCRALQELTTYLKFSPVHVLQPTRSSGNNASHCQSVGKVTKAEFKHGCHSDVSVDAALVRITDPNRIPVDGGVPAEKVEKLRAAGYDVSELPVFESGKILEAIGENERRNDVVKYGAESGLTRGSLNVDGSYVRIESKDLKIVERNIYDQKERTFTFTMYNQREVMNIGDRNFFELGDSGAFVFMLFPGDGPKCVGMAIGKTSYGSCIITPIHSVLQNLGLKSPLKLKSFPKYNAVLANSPRLLSKPSTKTKSSKKRSKQSQNRQEPFFGSRQDSSYAVSVDVLKSMDEKWRAKFDELAENYETRTSRIENSVSEIKDLLLENLVHKSHSNENNSQSSKKSNICSKRKPDEFCNASPLPSKKTCTFSHVYLKPQQLLPPDTGNDADYEFDISSVELNTPASNH